MPLAAPPRAVEFAAQVHLLLGIGWPRHSALAVGLLVPLVDDARAEARTAGKLDKDDVGTWATALLETAAMAASAGAVEPRGLAASFANAMAASLRFGSALRRVGRQHFKGDRAAWGAFRRGDGPEPIPEPPGDRTEGQKAEWLTGYRQAKAATRTAVAALPEPRREVRAALEAWQSGDIGADRAMRMTGVDGVPGLYALVAACGVAVRFPPSDADVAAAMAVLVAAGPRDEER